ncbi:FAD-dependent oxidoreductase [Sandaracinus amylolyticus]|uniref:FAD-dependent oxidoreductase n=1 Tax=Sandaracinus amylolyticus TaxID=927083 RepID=UPI001F206E51|nr:FAD-dependent oxidoreductase [Sandaracinus amylolyticus]UJR82136.1 FAD-dependent pyridine nucleotide-disulfide oxidoreductase [Sandaracinus amylolyticus]
MAHTIAIIGSGPAGFYAAEGIVKARPDAQVDIFDRLPTPYGLVRSGVAPDHQGTKNVWRVFQRTAQRPQVRFLGNVEMGRDVSLHELRDAYDAVVLAIGAPIDRELGVPGEHQRGVIGSHPFTSWYNGHPDWSGFDPDLDSSHIAIIGNGNVAVDVARVLGRTPPEMVKTDLPAYASERIARAPLTDIYMIGRRGPGEASFTPVELRELGDLANTVAVVDGSQLPASIAAKDPKDQKLKDKILEILRGYSQNDPQSKPVRLHIMFYAAPHEVLGDGDKVTGLRLMKTKVENGRAVSTGETIDLPVGVIVKAIGYYCRPIEGLPMPECSTCYPNTDGHVGENLWAVGWAKRGPSGVIATNRGDSLEVVDRMLKTLPEGSAKTGGRETIDGLLKQRGVHVVTFSDWEKIEKHEHETAQEGAPRVKLTEWEHLLDKARGT